MAAVIVNLLPRKGKPVQPGDFFTSTSRHRPVVSTSTDMQPWELQKQLVIMLNAGFGGKDLRVRR